MDDESARPARQYPVSPAKMSKTPSWVMLGFVLGAVTVFSLPQLRQSRTPAAPAVEKPVPAPPTAPSGPPRVSTVEAVFSEWARYAVWEFDVTEVALWNAEARDFVDYFEVLRYANRYYFRSLPALTRRVITRGKPIPECPLQFTETEEQYQEWRQHGRSERPLGDYRPVSAFAPAEEKSSPASSPQPRIAPPKFETLAPFEPPPIKPVGPTR